MADRVVSQASIADHNINEEPSEQVDPETLATRAKILKVVLVILALVCVIMNIFILAKSSQFFSYLFSLGAEMSCKTYLNQYYKGYMAGLYISIFGFVLVVADTIIFFVRFTQKAKLLYMHIVYLLTFFISSLVAIANSSYNDRMNVFSALPLTNSACTISGYLNECYLSLSYSSYRGNYISFFVVFLLFFIGYVIVYHYAVTKVLPLVKEEEKKEDESKSIVGANKKNETLVSEMFDEYLQ